MRVVTGGRVPAAWVAAAAWVSVSLHGCGAETDPAPPPPPSPGAALQAYCGADAAAVEARIDELLGQLTVPQKVALMHGSSPSPVDGVFLVEGIPELNIPGLHMVNGPRGVGAGTEVAATDFPVAVLRGATWAPELEARVGAAIAREARATGADVLLAPTINVLRHPRWGRAQETYGEDTHHVGELGVAFIRGVQSQRVIASAKHFAVNSIEDTRNVVDVTVDERTLREVYLPHFRRAVSEAQVGSVMSAYNSVNGAYCDLNRHLLTDILKDEWQFQGFVESDWYLGTHANVASLRAGLDLEMPSGIYYPGLAGAVADSAVTEAELDASVRRLLRARFCFELDLHPPVRDPAARGAPEHLALAQEVAERGIVLLKNRDAALPLSQKDGGLVVVGRLATAATTGDVGSSRVIATGIVTALDGIAARAANLTHIADADLSPSQREAVRAASAVIAVVGLTADDEGEGFIGAGDRADLRLPAEDAALIQQVAALNARTIVVLHGGGAIELDPWIDQVAALVMAWYPGQQGGHALARVLFGDVNPSGRLPVSFPVAEADLPAFDNVSRDVTYGFLHGYRHLDAAGVEARYPFGYGLSYTSFALSNPRLAAQDETEERAVVATVEVENTGDRPGIATIQLYVGVPGSAVERAPRDLRAFTQVALEPGQRRVAELTLDVQDLAFYDVDAPGWRIEPADYAFWIGTSSRELLPPLSISLPPAGP